VRFQAGVIGSLFRLTDQITKTLGAILGQQLLFKQEIQGRDTGQAP
jgi:hypothetical protein